MKKILAWSLAAALALTACGGRNQPVPDSGTEEAEAVELTLWTFPVGDWGNPTALSGLLAGFRRDHPNIHISVECLDYDTGDARINEAIAQGAAPDLVLESPERLVSNWGERGLMADLSDLWSEEAAGEIYDSVRTACRHDSGAYYVFPLCMSAHCMAVNYDLFQAAGALQYIDEESRTWSAEGFVQAVEALRAYGVERAAVVHCGSQAGDQGTRALVTNLYGGSFTDEDHTRYTFDSEENIRALELLRNLEGVSFAPELSGSGEVDLFCQGELAMAFCWNGALEVLQTLKYPDMDFRILPMTFPTDSGEPKLQYGIWGFGVFDNRDAERLAAAKEFIRYITGSDSQYGRAVQATNFWPVREMEDLYPNDAMMAEYSRFIPYMGGYCQAAPNWVEARDAWWRMLQQVGAGADIPEAVRLFSETANGSP